MFPWTLNNRVVIPSNSNFALVIPLVNKNDGNHRFCIDYKKLKQLTVRDQLPIPIVKKLIDESHVNDNFSKLDLRSGYHKIRINIMDNGKIYFKIMHEGFYEFIVIPFSLSNFPTTFQNMMSSIFKPYLR